MDDEAELFMFEIERDPWAAITEPLPENLYDLDALMRLRPIVYAVIHAFAWSLDDSLGLIGRPAEIDRRIALVERRSFRGQTLPIFPDRSFIERAAARQQGGKKAGLRKRAQKPNRASSKGRSEITDTRANLVSPLAAG